jgi:hypothetical protein
MSDPLHVEVAHWPFSFVLDARERQTGWALLNGPIVTRSQDEQFVRLRCARYRFIGISSYFDFPRGFSRDGLDYEMVCDAWCHCFRDPDRFLRSPLPRALISVSDFTNCEHIAPERIDRLPDDGRFDVVYVGAAEDWKRDVKNWDFAAQTIPRLCHELNLTTLVIGTPTPDFQPSEHVTFRDALPWKVLLSHIASARFVFVPNVSDPSPRIIAESLCLDTPVLMHREILGGWKYVNAYTGRFFDDATNVVEAARALCSAPVSPRRWFRANYGPYHAGRHLLALVRSLDPALGERSHLQISESVAEPVPDTSH